MISFKDQAKVMVGKMAGNIYFDGKTLKMEWRKVDAAYGRKAGRNSIWGLNFSEPLSDGCSGMSYEHAIKTENEARERMKEKEMALGRYGFTFDYQSCTYPQM